MPRLIAVRILLVVVLLFLFPRAVTAALAPSDPYRVETGSAAADRQATGIFPLVAEPDPVVRWMVDQVKQDTVRQYAGDLSGEWPVTIRASSYTIQILAGQRGEPVGDWPIMGSSETPGQVRHQRSKGAIGHITIEC